MLRKTFFIATLCIFNFQAKAMSEIEICKIRASTMQSIAAERDLGKSKKQVKKIFQKSLGENLPESFDMYLDLVYKEKNIKPKDIKNIFLYSCYQEFGLIK